MTFTTEEVTIIIVSYTFIISIFIQITGFIYLIFKNRIEVIVVGLALTLFGFIIKFIG